MHDENKPTNAGESGQEGVNTPAPAGQVTINREGSGHTINLNGSLAALLLGIITLILLRALLRAEARNRELLTQLAQANQRP